jgi:hypothetical protein
LISKRKPYKEDVMRKLLSPIPIAALYEMRILHLEDQLKKELEKNDNQLTRHQNIKKIEKEIGTSQSVINYYVDEICKEEGLEHDKVIQVILS